MQEASGCAWEKAKSKPVSLKRSRYSAEEIGISAKISLMEEVLPLMFWQPDSSWSRRDAAKACMAACMSMALQLCIQALVREWRRMAGA